MAIPASHERSSSWSPLDSARADNGVLVLKAPIDADKKRQIRDWLISFKVKLENLPRWTLLRDIIMMIAELKKEEMEAREGHELVKQIMAKKKAEQEPPQ